MKISIGFKLQQSPWGGGNQFGQALTDYLRGRGVQVYFDLNEPDLDIILLTKFRPQVSGTAYTDRSIFRYLISRNPNALVIHRVNECDERKKTKTVNRALIRANACADATIFVSAWLKELLTTQGTFVKPHRVILNGSDQNIFHSQGYHSWQPPEKLRLITHHWGTHWLKGFDIYQKLDDLLGTEKYRAKIDFTYVGQLPSGFRFHHATYIAPTQGEDLANILRKHHVYVTASRNEPGSNHQNEGALCGLPLLYIANASMPEYCQGFGVPFTPYNFEQKLDEMIATYAHWQAQMKHYSHTAGKLVQIIIVYLLNY